MTWKTNVGDLADQVMQALQGLHGLVPDEGKGHLSTLETYCGMSLEVLSKVNPSKLRAAAMNAELRSLIPPSPRK